MCGIVGFSGAENAVPHLIKGLERLQYRGYDSAGIAVVSSGKISRVRVCGTVEKLKEKLKESPKLFSGTGIGHTRWATHGAVNETNAHPHSGGKGIFTVVHNGIIENYSELKAELSREGVTFYSETDTEVIPNLIELCYCGDPLKAVVAAAQRLKGSFAFAAICRDFPERIICAKKGSPLVLATDGSGSIVSSDTAAISDFSGQVYYLDDGEFAEVQRDSIRFYSPSGEETKKQAVKTEHSFTFEDKGGYPHYMLKEIFQQSDTVRDTLKDFITDSKLNFAAFGIEKDRLRGIKNIDIVACGSAYHAGLIGEYFIREISGISTAAYLASEYRYSKGICKRSSLTVVISQSGETADSLAALKKAKEKGSLILGVVNVPMSSIALQSSAAVFTKAGAEIAVATTKAYTAQVTVMYLLGIFLAVLRGKLTEKDAVSLIDSMFSLCGNIRAVLGEKEKFALAAKTLCQSEHIYFIGRNTDFALCVEGALKMKEISYIHCEAYAAGELKHGTISLIEKGTPVIALCLRRDIMKKTLSNIEEVRSRGARVIVLTCEEMKGAFHGCEVLTVPDVQDCFSAVPGAVALQLLSYYTAKERGCDIDKPRSLAKSVTVE